MSLLRKALLVNLGEFLCILLGIANTVLLARFLGPTGVGQYAVVISAMSVAAQLFSLGLPLSCLYYAQREPENRQCYVTNTLWAIAILSMLGGVILTTIVWAIPRYFGDLSWYAYAAILAYLPLVLLRVVTRNTLLIAIEARRLSVMAVSSMLGGVGLVLVLILVGWFGVNQAIVCFVLAVVAGLVLGLRWTRRHWDFSVRPRWSIISRLLRMGIRQSWADLMVLVNAQLSVMLIKLFLKDFDSVGYYDRGQRVALLVVTAGQAVLPLLFSRWASLSEEQLADHVERVMRFVSTCGLLAIAGIVLTGKWVILIMYGREFFPAVVPMQILVPGAVLYLLSRTLMQLLGSRGVPELAAAGLMISSAVNAVLTWALISRMAIAGAAWASVAANLVLLTFILMIIRRRFGVRVTRCWFMGRRDIAGIRTALLRKRRTDVAGAA